MKANLKKIIIAGGAVAAGVAGVILAKNKFNKNAVEEVTEEITK